MDTIEGTSFLREFCCSHSHPLSSGLARRFFARALLISCPGKAAITELPGEDTTATRRLAQLRLRRTDCLSGFERAQDRMNSELYLATLTLALLDP